MAHVVCLVEPISAGAKLTGLKLTWSEGAATFSPYELSPRSLATAASRARTAYATVVECLHKPDDSLAAKTRELADKGHLLYEALFDSQEPHHGDPVRGWLQNLQSLDEVETLEVANESEIAVPWNLVYDCPPAPDSFQAGEGDPAPWRPFWGVRYDLSGTRRVSPLRRVAVFQNPRVVVVVDPFAIGPIECRKLESLCRENGWDQALTRKELEDALQKGKPDILYWIGHTQKDPFALTVRDAGITPDELDAYLQRAPQSEQNKRHGRVWRGLVFLNACSTVKDDQSGSFVEMLHSLRLSGYIATEEGVINTFAAPRGREFLSGFVERGEPLGQVMRSIRAKVPHGLVYGSYCPSSIHVRREPQRPAPDAAPIVWTQVERGKILGAAKSYPLPPLPYRSLQSYAEAERALFAGRDDDILRFAQLLDEPATRLVILHGESGVGKTSFLEAGVIPYLEQECLGYRFTRDRSKNDDETILTVRATNDPVAQIATALTGYCSRRFPFRTPRGEQVTADLPGVLRSAVGERTDHDALRDAFRSDPALLGRLLLEVGRQLPFSLVLVIDQAEEVYTLARTAVDEENRNQLLEMLGRAATELGGFRIVVSLRTEYYGRFLDGLRKWARATGGARDYLLTDFGLEALIEVIRRPTSEAKIEYASEVPGEEYQFRYGDGVAETIAERARAYCINRSDSVLPLVQVICTQLYDRVRERTEKVVTEADLEAIGGVEGGMRAHVEALLAELFPVRADQNAFKRLLAGPKTQLYLRQSDGTLTTALLPASRLAQHWSGTMPFDDVLDRAGRGDRRLLRVNSLRIGSDQEEQRYVSLGHDAITQVVARWQDEQVRRKHIRIYTARIILICIIISGSLFAYQAYQAEMARKQLKDIERREEARKRRDHLYVEAQQAASTTEPNWEIIQKTLKVALDIAKTDHDESDEEWLFEQSANELLAKATIEFNIAEERKLEKNNFTRLEELHADAVFYLTLASVLGLEDNLIRVHKVVADALLLFKVDITGDGPPQIKLTLFSAAEVETIVSRCYELLLLDAQALVRPIPGESEEAKQGRITEARCRVDRAERLLTGPKIRSEPAQRAKSLDLWRQKVKTKLFAKMADDAPLDRAVDYFLMGLEAHDTGDFRNAVAAFAAALETEPTHYGAMLVLAGCHFQLKQFHEAKIELTRCLQLRPKCHWPRLLRALAVMELAHRGSGRDSDALDDLNIVLDKLQDQTARYVAYTTRGVLAIRCRDWKSAIADLEKAIQQRPDLVGAKIDLASMHRNRAEDPLIFAFPVAPGGMFGYQVAFAANRRQALNESLSVLNAAIEQKPNESIFYHERGRLHLVRGDNSLARADLAQAVSKATTFGDTSTLVDDLLELGRLMHDAGDDPAAVKEYAKVFRIASAQLTGKEDDRVFRIASAQLTGEKRAQAALRLAESWLALKKWNETAVSLDLYLKLTPIPEGQELSVAQRRLFARAFQIRGLIHANRFGQRSAMLRSLSAVAGMWVMLLDEKDLRAALESYTRSLGFFRDPRVLVLRGRAYLASGATALGLHDFDESLRRQPGDTEALIFRAYARVNLGQYREALTDVNQALPNLPAVLLPEDRKELRLVAVRALAQIAQREPNPGVAGAHLTQIADLLRQVIPDIPAQERPWFWKDKVLSDPALSRMSYTEALKAVAAEFGAGVR